MKETVKQLQEYVNVPLAELVESSTNPRKTFDEERLAELAESIHSKGILSPLLTRRVNSHFEKRASKAHFEPYNYGLMGAR
jgi:ParB family chromosome partitioning protein